MWRPSLLIIFSILVGFSYEFEGCGISEWKPHGSTIFGGKEVPSNKYPWQVYLYSDAEHSSFCGGALISNDKVLTAAHCIVNQEANDLRVVLGADTLEDSEFNYVTVSDIKIYPDYHKTRGYVNTSDIGLPTLTTALPYNSTIRPVCLPTDASDLYIGINATIAGWGIQLAKYKKIISFSDLSDKLMEVDVEVISNSQCSWNFIQKYLEALSFLQI